MNAMIPAITAVAALPALIAPAVADEPAVFPTPKQASFVGEATEVKDVTMEMRTPESRGDIWDRLPDKPGGYAIVVREGALHVYANDADGVYYAKQTLTQLLQGAEDAANAQADPFPDMDIADVAKLDELPLCTIVDWPDMPFRGVVEGYYGTPWSQAARESQFRFYGRNKMNMYIYGPKDDAYHHGKGCYLPYPEEKAKEIAHLVKVARENHVRFVWAIHPANTVDWSKDGGRPQLDKLCGKLEQLYAMGVRDFGVFVDDSAGEILKPERQAQLCNYIIENFIRKHPEDVNQQLIMVPTGYNKGWTTPKFLNTLGSQLQKDTLVMWTGDTVVNDITLQGQKWVHKHLGRPTFIWWNWPCSDFKRGRLSMGRTYGLGTEPEMLEEMTGFTANPMEQAEASKVGLFGVADYSWNITGFRSDESWREGIRRLYPQCPEAMQAFCDHNSYLLPNGHRYYREESIEMHEPAKAFINSVNAWKPDMKLALVMQREYRRMARAGERLRTATGIDELRDEIKPWIDAFTLTGQAGEAVISSMQAKSNGERRKYFFRAVNSMNKMSLLTRMDWNNGRPKPIHDVEAAAYIMVPALKDAFSYCNSLVYADLSGRKPTTLRPTFSTNGGDPVPGVEKINDGNVMTFWESGKRMEAGHWYCLDLGEPTPVTSISLLMGTTGRPKDYAEAGQMEYSLDGETWTPLGGETRGANVVIDLADKPLEARMVRYRVTQPRYNWMAIAEFRVNRGLPSFAASTVPGFSGVTTFRDEKMFGINRVMELHKARPGDSIELHFPEPVKGSWLEVDLDNERIDQWAKVELTLANGEVVEVRGTRKNNKLIAKGKALPAEAVTSMKLTHVGNAEEEVRLNVFKLDVPSADPARNPDNLTDCNFATACDCSKGLEQTLVLPAGTTQVVVVGSADCSVDGVPGKRSGMVQRFELPEGKAAITLKAEAQPGEMVNEVIFRHRK